MSDAWDNFIAGLNPDALEQERMRHPVDVALERPWDAEDVRMRTRHAARAAEYHALRTGHLAQLVMEADGWTSRALDRAAEERRHQQIRAYALHRKQHAA